MVKEWLDFENTIIIMKSNIEGDLTGEFDEVRKQTAREIKKVFRAALLNRLDDVIVFKRLGYLQMKAILEIMLKQVYERLEVKKIVVTVTERLEDKLVKEGYNPTYAARPLRRAISRLLEDKLAEMILKDEVKEHNTGIMYADSDGEVVMNSH